eukprot:SAG31_NODE_214_length_20084_cov_2.644684_8_plen_197_part_00
MAWPRQELLLELPCLQLLEKLVVYGVQHTAEPIQGMSTLRLVMIASCQSAPAGAPWKVAEVRRKPVFCICNVTWVTPPAMAFADASVTTTRGSERARMRAKSVFDLHSNRNIGSGGFCVSFLYLNPPISMLPSCGCRYGAQSLKNVPSSKCASHHSSTFRTWDTSSRLPPPSSEFAVAFLLPLCKRICRQMRPMGR